MKVLVKINPDYSIQIFEPIECEMVLVDHEQCSYYYEVIGNYIANNFKNLSSLELNRLLVEKGFDLEDEYEFDDAEINPSKINLTADWEQTFQDGMWGYSIGGTKQSEDSESLHPKYGKIIKKSRMVDLRSEQFPHIDMWVGESKKTNAFGYEGTITRVTKHCFEFRCYQRFLEVSVNYFVYDFVPEYPKIEAASKPDTYLTEMLDMFVED